jgi:hypothetical protein
MADRHAHARDRMVSTVSGAGNHEAAVAAGLLADEGEKSTMSHAPSC